MKANVRVIILTYNNMSDIQKCIESILNQTYSNFDVCVVDNASTDTTIEYIRSKFPQVKIIQNDYNLGYAAGNNIGFEASKNSDYIAILNPDTEVDVNWLDELVKPMESNPSIGMTTSKILLYNDRNVINTCGIIAHFTGLTFCRGLYESTERYSAIESVAGVSGCSFLIRTSLAKNLGLFDPDFFMYNEDTELSWRVLLAGYEILTVPSSKVYHKYKSNISPTKYFYLERNRYLMLLIHYDVMHFLIFLPSLALAEIIIWCYAIINGSNFVKYKIKSYIWLIKYHKKIKIKIEINNYINNDELTNRRKFLNRLSYLIPFEQVSNNKHLLNIFNVINKLFYLNYLVMSKYLHYRYLKLLNS